MNTINERARSALATANPEGNLVLLAKELVAGGIERDTIVRELTSLLLALRAEGEGDEMRTLC